MHNKKKPSSNLVKNIICGNENDESLEKKNLNAKESIKRLNVLIETLG